MEQPTKAMTKSELVVVLNNLVANGSKNYDTKLSDERKKVLDYYNGTLPKPAHAGSSKYVSLDVFDAVESMKAELLETFAAGRNIVTFDPMPTADTEALAKNIQQAKVQTQYCDYVVFTQNDGFKIFSDVIQDGLMSRVGVAKVYWETIEEEVEEEFENISDDELEGLTSNPKYTLKDSEQDEYGLWSGSLTSTVNKSQVRIEVLPPEEFIINSHATSLSGASFCAHRTRKTKSDLIKAGYKRSVIDALPAGEEGDNLNTAPEVLARFEPISSGSLGDDSSTQDQGDHVLVYECYLKVDMDGSGIQKLYKCVMAGNKLLDDPEECSHLPFVDFCPMPVPHSFYGSNYAEKVIATQNARTTLTRSILDHTLITNNPRFMVVKGALTNPKEMLENRLGGLVNVTRPDGIMPLPQGSLNPFVFQTIQLLDEDKEERTGISKLSQGMNKDAVSKQNSAAMVENLVSMGQKRQKIIARIFANQFVKNLYVAVYRLVNANEEEGKVIKVSGSFVRVNPAEWDERTDATVELKLGYGEQEREAQKYLQMHQMLSMDPTAGPLYQLPNKFAMLKRVFDKAGILDVGDLLTHPEQAPKPQPDPKVMADIQFQQETIKIQQAQVEVSRQKVESHAQIEAMKLEMQKMQDQMADMMDKQKLALDVFEVHSRLKLDKEELDLAAKQDPASTKAILSPSF